jgi:hypothetical protein
MTNFDPYSCGTRGPREEAQRKAENIGEKAIPIEQKQDGSGRDANADNEQNVVHHEESVSIPGQPVCCRADTHDELAELCDT